MMIYVEAPSRNKQLKPGSMFLYQEVVRLLLENGANIDVRNLFKCTPIFSAIEGLQRKICHYLIEWGCDVHCRNSKNQTPFESVKNDEFKKYLIDTYEYYSSIVPRVMAGDMAMFDEVVRKHVAREQELCCLRSR
ncbi:hypothetical protein KUTeg_023563 [Tegillarca granosa]|uniref:Uncharacterized protein n=1 Tax=Tegillarca granosa TaxID=220873 RepID=A0ABQ9E869_TEGGR|nr:hypothetical protein KUTeg_023563 [Tegillarca granosa]